jgi:AMMECR1 domain-containing protein
MQIGTHGIRLKWRVDGRDYSATYLPEVAPEQGDLMIEF